ncbi:MAG: CPBP family intramembrane metalloprotease [Sulfurimonas sp.]
MALFTLLSLLAWRILLKKDVPIAIKTLDATMLKSTFLLFAILLFAIVYFLNAFKIDYGIMSLMLLTSLATGIYEEIIFRGITLGSLVSAGVKPSKAIYLSAMIFSLFHLSTVYDSTSIDIILKMLNTFMMGVIFAYIYYKSHNILYVIIIHSIWDFESFLAQQQQNVSDKIGESIAIILFAMTVLYFSWSYKKIVKL